MENSTKNQKRTPSGRKRKRTRAAKLAYARAATLGVVALAVLGVSIHGAAQALRKAPPEAPQQPQPQVTGTGTGTAGTPEIETMASSSITVLTGDSLRTALDTRIEKLSATVEANAQSLEASTRADAAAAPTEQKVTPVTPTPAIPETFDPASLGTSGFVNIAPWKEKNSDVVGWLKIPNSNINYPVVVGANNNTYASIGYYKEPSRNGVIWADSDTKFGGKGDISQNTVLYGHNWANVWTPLRIGDDKDVMFGQLPSFHHLSFAQITPYIYYSTGTEEMVWKVFAVFYTEDTFNYIAADPGADGMTYIINEAKARSRHKYEVDVNSSDKILTLSTCTRVYGNTDRQRFVVMARLVRPDESIEAVTITANPNHKQPQL